MKTRLRFKIIAVLICLSLVGLLISQGYWLKGLYVSSKKSTWDNIEEAMRMADYMELFLRLVSFPYTKRIKKNITVCFSTVILIYSFAYFHKKDLIFLVLATLWLPG